MKRFLFGALLFSLALGAASATAFALGTDLGPDTVQALLRDGERCENIGQLVAAYAPPASFDNSVVADRVQVLTTRTILRLMGFESKQSGQPADAESVDAVISRPMLTILIYARGSDPQLAVNVEVSLVQDGKTIKPETLINPRNADMESTSGALHYNKIIMAHFAYDMLNPNAKAQMVYNRDERKLTYDVDLPNLD